MQDLSRDRDATGRPRNARPRDELGRPLPHDGGTAEPDPPALPPAEALAEAQRLLDDGRPFRAHEVLEAVWKETSQPADRELWRGLAQLAVGLTHHSRGNATGAASLLRRSAENLVPYSGSSPYGVAVDELRTWAQRAAATGDVTDVPRLQNPSGG